jgi:hypothetical protein
VNVDENGDSSSKDRNSTWEVILIALVAVVGGAAIVAELTWPGRSKLFYPWGQPLLIAVLWSSFFVILSKRLLRKWEFWIALVAGIVAQVWIAKVLVVNGAFLISTVNEGTVLLGVVVWGLAYLVFTWIRIALDPEDSGNSNRQSD